MMSLLVITNVKKLTGILHRHYNAAQNSTRMEKHHASNLNRCCNHSDRSTPDTQGMHRQIWRFPWYIENIPFLASVFVSLDKYTLKEKHEEFEFRSHVMKWVFIDAHHVGYDELIALLYSKNPQTCWHPLIKDVYAMTMSYFKEWGIDKFIELSFVDITCDNIHSWISLSGDLAFSHQDGIYGFKFPERFLEISSRDLTSLFSLLAVIII